MESVVAWYAVIDQPLDLLPDRVDLHGAAVSAVDSPTPPSWSCDGSVAVLAAYEGRPPVPMRCSISHEHRSARRDRRLTTSACYGHSFTRLGPLGSSSEFLCGIETLFGRRRSTGRLLPGTAVLSKLARSARLALVCMTGR